MYHVPCPMHGSGVPSGKVTTRFSSALLISVIFLLSCKIIFDLPFLIGIFEQILHYYTLSN
jgi:hypothetical protein